MAGHRRKRSLEPLEDGGGSARLTAPPWGFGQETRAWSAPQERVSRIFPSRSNSGAYCTPPHVQGDEVNMGYFPTKRAVSQPPCTGGETDGRRRLAKRVNDG